MNTRIIVFFALILISLVTSQPRARVNGEIDPPIPEPAPETRPNPPSLKVLWKTADSIKVEWWDRSQVESGYKLRQMESDGNWTLISNFGPLDGSLPRQSYEILGLFPETEYCFQVIAYNNQGFSGPSTIQESCAYTTSEKSCSETKIEEVLALATSSAASVRINCDLTLEPGQVITKRLIFYGAEASGVTVDLNGATVGGGKGTFNFGKEIIQIMSRETEVRNTEDQISSYSRPQNITIKNGTIDGKLRVWGMSRNGQGDWEFDKTVKILGIYPPIPFSNQLLKSSRMSGHTARVRINAPRNIVFDNLIINATGTLYFGPGVTNSKLINSEVKGQSNRAAIYLDTESWGNTIRNNSIHVSTKSDKWGKVPGVTNRGWPLIAIDGSNGNKIINNRFSSLNNGGIYLYRNCGEGGVIRHATPSHNLIINNIFFYKKYTGHKPSVYLSSRNYGWKENTFGHCDKDDGYPFGSSDSNRDYARHNVVMQNQFYKRKINIGGALIDAFIHNYIKVKNQSLNSPNYIDYNQIVTEETVYKERPAGCYVKAEERGFILHEEFFEVFNSRCNNYRYTCDDGELVSESIVSNEYPLCLPTGGTVGNWLTIE